MASHPRIWAGLAAVTLPLLFAGCEKPVVAQGSKATAGGIELSIGEYELRYVEIADATNTYEYPQPVLIVPVTLKNVGEGTFTYSPTHQAQQSSEALTPLLYHAPTGDAADKLPPANKNLVNGVMLTKGALDGQITKSESIPPGETISDLILFEPPPAASKLIFSMPPAAHRGNFPVLFKIDYQPTEPAGPKMHRIGEAAAFGMTHFSVTHSEVVFVKTRDTLLGEGFSSEPLLKISYEIENKGSSPVSYDPAHRALGGRGAALFGKDTTYKRVKFAVSTTVDGQRDGTTQIAAGEKLTDFVLFDRPGEGTSELTFEYPATLFGGTGLARFTLDYEYSNPPTPKELKAPAKRDPDQGG